MTSIIINRGADAWQNIGLIALFEFLMQLSQEEDDSISTPQITSHFVSFNYEKEKDSEFLADRLCQMVQNQMNRVPLLPIELRILNRSDGFVKGNDGFYPVRMPVHLSDQEIEEIKMEIDLSGKKKVYLKNPQKKVDITLMRNFIGIRTNWEDLKKNYQKIVSDFIAQLESIDAIKKKICSLCGESTASKWMYPMNQSRNPLMSQHHNTKVRGYYGSVNKGSMCAVCNFLNVLASLYVQKHPYFVSPDNLTHLLIPETNDLRALREILQRVEKALDQFGSANVWHYRTNIHEIGQRTLYPAMFALYFWLEHETQTSEIVHEPMSDRARRSIHKWTIPRYAKGQNVIFKHFTEVGSGEIHFDLVKEINYGFKKDKKGNVVQEFLNKIRLQDPLLMNQLAEGLWKRDWRLLRQVLFQTFKRKIQGKEPYLNHSVFHFFQDYFQHLLMEVEHVIPEKKHEDIRKLASVISNNCVVSSNNKVDVDIAMLTKFNNATSAEAFRRVLSELGFTILKRDSAASKKSEKENEERFHISPERLQRVMEYVMDDKSFRETRDLLMIYVSSYAHQNYVHRVNSTNEKEGA